MKFDSFEDIIVWQKAEKLGVRIYQAFAHSRDYSFKDQIQRAAVSIGNNIAEGFERGSNPEFKHFLYISKGSCGELRSMLYLARDLGKITEGQFESLKYDCLEISRMLSALITTL